MRRLLMPLFRHWLHARWIPARRLEPYQVIRSRFHSRVTGRNAEDVTVVFVDQDDNDIEVTVPSGTTILEAAHQNEVEIEGACDGCMACSTCHVILDEQVYDALPEPEEEELDMLDLAPGVTDTSRLGCQVKLDPSLEGIRIRLPKLTRNFYVDGHVPKPH